MGLHQAARHVAYVKDAAACGYWRRPVENDGSWQASHLMQPCAIDDVEFNLEEHLLYLRRRVKREVQLAISPAGHGEFTIDDDGDVEQRRQALIGTPCDSPWTGHETRHLYA